MQAVANTTPFQLQLVAYMATPEVGNIQDPTEATSAEELIDIIQRHKAAFTDQENDTLDLLYTKWKTRLGRLENEELKGRLLDTLTTPNRRSVQERLALLASVKKINIDAIRKPNIPTPESLVARFASLLHIGNATEQKLEPTDAEVGEVFLQYLSDNAKYIDDRVSTSLDVLHAYWRQRRVVRVAGKLSELLLQWHPFHRLLACVQIFTAKRNYQRPPAILAAINYEETGGRFCKIRRLCTQAWNNLSLNLVVHLRAFTFTLNMEDRANRLARLVRFLIQSERWDEAKLIVSEYNRRSSTLRESFITHFQGKILSGWADGKVLQIVQRLEIKPRVLSFQTYWNPAILNHLTSVDTLQAWLHQTSDKNQALCEQIAKMPKLEMLGLGISDPTRTNELFSIESLRNLKILSLTLSNVAIPRVHCDVLATFTKLVYLTVQMPTCKIDNAAQVSVIVQHAPCTLTHLQLKATAQELRLCFPYLGRFTELQEITLDPTDDDGVRFQKEARVHYKLKT